MMASVIPAMIYFMPHNAFSMLIQITSSPKIKNRNTRFSLNAITILDIRDSNNNKKERKERKEKKRSI
jgi:hypothetical protein